MQYEAMMCPMTMFELGKCQKVVTEEKMMLQAAASNNARMAAEKQRLEGALQVSAILCSFMFIFLVQYINIEREVLTAACEGCSCNRGQRCPVKLYHPIL